MAETRRRAGEWRAGWQTVLVASLGISLSTGHVYSQGLFMAPLEQAFGWTRTQVTTGPFLTAWLTAIGVIIAGVLADRYGARRVVLPGVMLYVLAMGALTLTSGNIWQWYASWLLIAIPLSLATPAVWTSAVVARFSIARGFALALALAGNGISTAISPQIIEYLIEHYGWRAGFAFFPAFSLLLVLPLALLLFDRTPRPAAPVPTRAAAPSAPGIGSAIRSAPFFLLMIASLTFAFGLMALMGHLVPIVTERGLDRTAAAGAVGVVGLCSVIGRLGTGFLVDRFNSALVAAITFLLPLVPLAMLIEFDGSLTMAFGASILLGLSLGAEVDLIAYLSARYFGLRRYATFVGIMHGTGALAVGGGPLVGGMIHDATGRYDLLLWILAPVFLVGGAAIIALGRLKPVGDGDGEAEGGAEAG